MEVCGNERNILSSEVKELMVCEPKVYPCKNSVHSLEQAPSSIKEEKKNLILPGF